MTTPALTDAPTRRLMREIAALPRQGLDVADVFRQAIQRIGQAIVVDAWCGLTLDPATLLMTGGVHESGLGAEAGRRLLEIECGGEDFNPIVELARRTPPVGWLSEAAQGQLESSERYRDVLHPCGYQHELRAVARSGARAWGAVILLRSASSPDFVPRDKQVLATLAPAVAEALRGALLVSAASNLPSAATDRAVVVLNGRNTLASASQAGRRWLDELAEHGPLDPHGVPHTVQMLANEARRACFVGATGGDAAAGDQCMRQVRARTRSGQWLTLHATAMAPASVPARSQGVGTGGGTAAGGGADIHVAVLIEPSRPLEVASLILEAYGLTPREGELVHCVLQGFDTGQIAELMAISNYTVQDHLKKVFDKVGVWSRKELVQRLFFKHYLPRMQQGLPLGPDGWFLERR